MKKGNSHKPETPTLIVFIPEISYLCCEKACNPGYIGSLIPLYEDIWNDVMVLELEGVDA